jgi:UDP-N-acetyl-D-mannosaminuronate dehydrogenase
MPFYVIHMAEETLKMRGKTIGNSGFAVLGVTYKRDVADVRRTPAKTVITELLKLSKDVAVFDPFTSEAFGARSGSLEEAIAGKDCVILLVDHSYFRENDVEGKLNELSPDCCLVDTRNFVDQKKLEKSILYRCLGKPSDY